jgi:hypothetical protein
MIKLIPNPSAVSFGVKELIKLLIDPIQTRSTYLIANKSLVYEIEHSENVTHWDVSMAIGTEMRDSMWP